ncbi:MAG: hypothetical protein H7Y30_11455 [Pyrinomonadaceae bacterium]|nr:hypothetical protein [Pyrinomonadaceae bacterium]
MSDSSWIGWQGIIAHPNSPAGGSGPGGSRSPRPLGLSFSFHFSVRLYVRLPARLSQVLNDAAELSQKTVGIIKDLAMVEWTGILDETGLEGEWRLLTVIWFLEYEPPGLGKWSIEAGVPLVTITSEDYAHDLQKKPNYQETLQKFKQEHPILAVIKAGDQTSNDFLFTGKGSASGKYNALEWFMGSYHTDVTAISTNLKAKSVKVHVKVSNTSHWQSATRLPKSFIDKGLPRYLVPNADRKKIWPGGTFKQNFIWEDTIKYN